MEATSQAALRRGQVREDEARGGREKPGSYHIVEPGKTAPREAACAPVAPAVRFGTLLGRVIGTRAFGRAL